MDTPYVTLGLLLLTVLAACCVGMTYVMARVLLRPPRMTDGKALYVLKRLSPADLGLAFEAVSFDVKDEHGKPLRIATWWLPAPAPSARAVVILHGYGDAKVGGIAWAPMFHSLGWNVLALDLRAHGESGGTATTAGYFERHDVEQVLNQLRSARPTETKFVALFGVSVGAAIALATAVTRDDLAAVICESPYTDYGTAARLHGKRMGLPAEFLQPFALRWAQHMTAARFADIRPIDLITRLAAPLLVFHAGDDPLVSAFDVARFAEVLKTRPGVTEHVVVPHAAHSQTITADPEAYRATIERFLATATGE